MKPSKCDPEEFAVMWKAGVSAQEIADRFGYARRETITEVANRLGLPPRKGASRNEQRNEKIRHEYRLGARITDLANKYDLGTGSVARIVNKKPDAIDGDPSDTRVKAWSCAPAAVARYLKQKGARA